MQLSDYFKKHGIKPTPWAKAKGISPAVISRYLNKKMSMSFKNALKIEEATKGKVSHMELLVSN